MGSELTENSVIFGAATCNQAKSFLVTSDSSNDAKIIHFCSDVCSIIFKVANLYVQLIHPVLLSVSRVSGLVLRGPCSVSSVPPPTAKTRS